MLPFNDIAARHPHLRRFIVAAGAKPLVPSPPPLDLYVGAPVRFFSASRHTLREAAARGDTCSKEIADE